MFTVVERGRGEGPGRQTWKTLFVDQNFVMIIIQPSEIGSGEECF